MSESKIADIVGETTAKRIKDAQERTWGISEALTTEFTHKENNPPNGVSKNVRDRILIGNISRTIIKTAKSEYKLNDETETLKKLLRVGLEQIYTEWGTEINKLAEGEDAITYATGHIEEDEFTVSYADEEKELQISTSKEESERYYILWYQDFYADKISDELNIPKTNVLRLAIILAGRELGFIDDIPPAKSRKIESIVENVDSQIQSKVAHIEQLAFGPMITALNSENKDDIHSKLDKECPHILESFMSKIKSITEMEGR